jgi:hypothetical protein
MNDFDLEKKLKNVCVPERKDEYWDDFPSRIRVQLRRERREFTAQSVRHPRLAWAGGLALTMALVCVCLELHPLRTTTNAIAWHEQHFRAHLAQLETGLHRLMLNTDGMGYLLAEAN